MKKVKFNIQGMHCNSCAALIEQNIKDLSGILQTKVSYDSKKGVALYDEKKISESLILEAAKKSGDYKIQKEEAEEEFAPAQTEKEPPDKLTSANSKSDVMKNFLILFSLVSLALNVYFLTKNSISAANNNLAAVIPAVSNNPSPSPAQIQSFNITAVDHVRGNFNAPVTLVEFSDFQCPFCGRHEPTINKILNDYPNQIRFVYKHFPLPIHQYGQKAAEASECADEQKKFWEYHDILLANQTDFNIDNFKKWAADLKLNTGQFNSCLDSGKYTAKVQTDYQEGAQKGVSGTPTTFINGRPVVGAQPYETFKQIIDNLLSQ